MVMVTETADMYERVIAQFIQTRPLSRVQWVYNILNGVSEQEHILASDPDPEVGWVILPDSKWDKRTRESLYLLVLAKDIKLRSIRDLSTQKHLDMLKKMRKAIQDVAFERYNVAANQLCLYFHYHPTYYHLHIHAKHLATQDGGKVGGNTSIGKAILLETVIDQMEFSVSYYQKCSITYVLAKNTELWKEFILTEEYFLKNDD